MATPHETTQPSSSYNCASLRRARCGDFSPHAGDAGATGVSTLTGRSALAPARGVFLLTRGGEALGLRVTCHRFPEAKLAERCPFPRMGRTLADRKAPEILLSKLRMEKRGQVPAVVRQQAAQPCRVGDPALLTHENSE